MEYKKITTSAEVWAAIRARHPELRVFSSYSAPDGDRFGDHSQCEMMTEYGFEYHLCPIIGARTTWEKDEKSYDRVNEKHQYWLCVPVDEEV